MSNGGVRVEVNGATTVAATLGEAGRDLEAMAPEQVGHLIQGRARAAAPFLTGRLRASLAVETDLGIVSVGSALPYAAVIHNGWAAHNIAANPYLIPVAEDSQSIWGPLYVAETNRIIKSDVRGA